MRTPQEKPQQQKHEKIPKKIWVPRSLQFNQEGRPEICEHLTNTQGSSPDELLKFITSDKKSQKEIYEVRGSLRAMIRAKVITQNVSLYASHHLLHHFQF